MSYTPTVWETGNVVTAQKLNKLENGLATVASDADDLKSQFNSVATVEQTTVPGSVNVYNPANTTAGYYLNNSGVPQAGSGYGYSEKIQCAPGDVVRFYVISSLNTFPGNLYYADESIGSVKGASDFYSPGTTGGVASFTVPVNVTHFSINLRTGYNDEFIITINNAYPESYVPYAPPVSVFIKKINEDTEIPANYLFGKKWAACGDSITYGSAADVDAQGNRKTYAYYVAKRNNMSLTVDAVAGSTLANVENKDGFSVSRYQNLPADLDYITIFFGINDSGSDVPIGDISDATNETFYGAWNVVLQYLIEHYPTTKIGIVVNYGGSESYRNATRAICTKYGIVPFDIMGSNLPLFAGRESGVNSAISNARKATFLADGTHPNNAGYVYMSTYFEQYLRSL